MFDVLAEDHPLVVAGKSCPGCELVFKEGDSITLVSIGPGNDPEEQEKAREGRAYNAVALAAHYKCVTGRDSD